MAFFVRAKTLFAEELQLGRKEGIMKALLLKRKWAFMVYILASCLFIVSDLLYMSLSSMIFDALEKGSLTLFINRIVLGHSYFRNYEFFIFCITFFTYWIYA